MLSYVGKSFMVKKKSLLPQGFSPNTRASLPHHGVMTLLPVYQKSHCYIFSLLVAVRYMGGLSFPDLGLTELQACDLRASCL